jgi:hypothetical protein
MTYTLDFNPMESEVEYIVGNVSARQKASLGMSKLVLQDVINVSMSKSSKMCLVKTNNIPIAIVGVGDYPLEDDTGIVWAAVSREAKEKPIAFTKALKELIECYCFKYKHLISFVAHNDKTSERFQRTLGFIPGGDMEIVTRGVSRIVHRYDYLTRTGLAYLLDNSKDEDHE